MATKPISDKHKSFPAGSIVPVIKVTLLGDSSTGKTEYLDKYIHDNSTDFVPSFVHSIGIDFKVKVVTLNGENVKLQIWDTAGQERFRAISGAYHNNVQGSIVIYNVGIRSSFDSARAWVNSVPKGGLTCAEGDKVKTNYLSHPVVLIGIETTHERIVKVEEGQALAKEFNVPFYEVTLQSSQIEIEAPFMDLIKKIQSQKKDSK